MKSREGPDSAEDHPYPAQAAAPARDQPIACPLDALPVPVAVVRRRDGRILHANDRLAALLGQAPSQVAGGSIEALCGDLIAQGALGRGAAGAPVEGLIKKATGELLPVEVSFGHLSLQGEEAALLAFRDLAKQRLVEQELSLSKRMEVLGRLASGIVHDFNNLLTIIVGWGEIALNQCRSESPLKTHLQEILGAGNRAASLTRQLLSFSSRQEQRPQELDVNKIVGAMDTLLQRLIGEDIYLETVLDPNAGHVKADPSQIEQIIMNLVVNARDAMPHGGKLSLRTTQAAINTPHLHGHAVQPGPYVRLTVTDTGHGMDADTQSRIFEPFFTTKGEGKGTGLGLSTVLGIVKQLDGLIAVESEPDCGSTFTVYLPAAQETIAVRHEDVESSQLPCGTETILVVEDDPGVRRLIVQTLQKHGYVVIEARHGIEAWMIGSQYADPIHLLLTDVVMPQMSGRAVADRLQAIRRDMKVLFISGHTDDAVFHHGIVDSGQGFLHKPFNPNVLVRKVRDLLDGSTTAGG